MTERDHRKEPTSRDEQKERPGDRSTQEASKGPSKDPAEGSGGGWEHDEWDAERTREELSQAWNKAREGLGALGRRLKKGATASRHRVEASLLQRERGQLLESIGEQVYERIREAGPEGFPQQILNLCARVAQLDEMIQKERETARDHWDGMVRGEE